MVYVGSPRLSTGDDAEDPEDAATASGNASNGTWLAPRVQLERPVVPALFPTITIVPNRSATSHAWAIAQALAVHGTSAVDVVLESRYYRPRMLQALAALPAWLDAVAIVAPRHGDYRTRFRIVKGVPLWPAHDNSRFMGVSTKVSIEKVTGFMLNGTGANAGDNSFAKVSNLRAGGGRRDTQEMVLHAIECLHWDTRYDVMFSARFGVSGQGKNYIEFAVALS